MKSQAFFLILFVLLALIIVPKSAHASGYTAYEITSKVSERWENLEGSDPHALFPQLTDIYARSRSENTRYPLTAVVYSDFAGNTWRRDASASYAEKKSKKVSCSLGEKSYCPGGATIASDTDCADSWDCLNGGTIGNDEYFGTCVGFSAEVGDSRSVIPGTCRLVPKYLSSLCPSTARQQFFLDIVPTPQQLASGVIYTDPRQVSSNRVELRGSCQAFNDALRDPDEE